MSRNIRRRRRAIIASVVGLLAGLAYPIIDVAVACRVPGSEACVWGKAYLPLNVALGTGLVGGFVGIIVFVALSVRNRKKEGPEG